MLRPYVVALTVAMAGYVSAADAQQYDSTKTFNLATNNQFPTAMWSDGTTMWVGNDYNPDRAFAYHISDKTRDSTRDFSDLDSIIGIWSDGTTIWVANFGTPGTKIFAYTMTWPDPPRDATKDFNTLIDAGNARPSGIWSDGTTMWVGDRDDDKIYAYHISDKSRDTSKDFNTLIDAGNTYLVDIWSDGTTMWVGDFEDKKIYAYKMSDKSRDPGKDIALSTVDGNDHMSGIWSDCKTMWVVDYQDEKIYAYTMPAGTVCPAPPTPTPSPSRTFVYVPPPDRTPPTVRSVERAGNATTTDTALTWYVRFSEPVRIDLVDILRTTYDSAANATIPDLGTASDTISVDGPREVTGGSVSVDLDHTITSGLLIELVAPDCTTFVIHNQTVTFLYKLRQPYDLGNLTGVGAAGQWTIHVSDHARYWNGTLNAWSLNLESEGMVQGSGSRYTITQHVAGPGNHTLSLDMYDIRDRAGNRLSDREPKVNEPYHVLETAVPVCLYHQNIASGDETTK